MKLAASLVVAGGLLVTATDARAEDWMPFLPVGATVGYSVNPHKLANGPYFGGEASLVFLNQSERLAWVGGYVDTIHDFGSKATHISLGPEIGLAFLGLDGGAVLSTLDGVHAGLCGRFLLSLIFVHAYGRIGGIFDSPREGVFGEIGLMGKLPFPLNGFEGPRPPPPPPPPVPPPGPDLPIAVPPDPPPT